MRPTNTFSLDGKWEVDYLMTHGKSFDELYPRHRPTLVFNSKDGSLSGLTGCNNFIGKFEVEHSKLTIDRKLGVTKKMCPDMAGEKLFLETLPKVTAYALSDQGQTLNLIAGDLAVLRASRG